MDRFGWERVIRRVQMHTTAKGIALILASYADSDGSRIRPGIQRMARVSCTSEKTVRRHVKFLCDAGFLVRTKHGNRWIGEVNEYQLTIPVDLLNRMPMIDPNELVQTAPVDEPGSLTVTSDRQNIGSEELSNGHPDMSNGHMGLCLTVMGDRPPTQDQPLPDQQLSNLPTERTNRITEQTNSDYVPANAAYAAWRADRSRVVAL